jgi:hypothetical protein
MRNSTKRIIKLTQKTTNNGKLIPRLAKPPMLPPSTLHQPWAKTPLAEPEK